MKITINTAPKNLKPDGCYTWIQNTGWVVSVKAEDIQVGMTLICNYGYTYKITSVDVRGKTAHITVLDDKGNEYKQSRRGIVPAQFTKE